MAGNNQTQAWNQWNRKKKENNKRISEKSIVYLRKINKIDQYISNLTERLKENIQNNKIWKLKKHDKKYIGDLENHTLPNWKKKKKTGQFSW